MNFDSGSKQLTYIYRTSSKLSKVVRNRQLAQPFNLKLLLPGHHDGHVVARHHTSLP